ncbi:acyl carrier protein [Thermoleophilum album]|jgi:acyl carrier protein|uniref:acyl carrier protein n=1 Tax=Thermoleophilum album TaxID=29539 RepID=UPI000CC46F01|nr:acyl carrier protein [Thermoleophilum album]MCL6441053.1 acyl carrier protein [Thermoleophilum sp.]WDT93288.1 acyl carrier protein [Thermoleophilum album]GBD45764.1 Acyl carrier protein [bacterium HR41]
MAQQAVTREQIEERVLKALVEFGADPDKVAPDAEFEALDIDSLDLVELAQIVEDEYGVQLEGKDMEGLRTVAQAVDLIASRVA